MSRVTLRPTIAADLPSVIGEPLPYRIKAVSAVVDGKVIGLGGIAFPPDGPVIAFAQLAPASSVSASEEAEETTPEAKRYPVAFHRAGLMAVQMMQESGAQEVLATANAGNHVAIRWLRRLGFTPADFQPINGRVLFIWTPNTPPTQTFESGAHHGSPRHSRHNRGVDRARD